MAGRFRCIALFIVVVVVVLSASEGRPLKDQEEEVRGIFRTMKNSGPTLGPGHGVKKVENMKGMKKSGPSQGGGHWLAKGEEIGAVKQSGPSPGQGHKAAFSEGNGS